MLTRFKIAVQVPDAQKKSHYFSFHLEQDLHDEKAKYRQAKKVFVVSDIEGNFRQLCKLLIVHKVVDKKLDWIYGDNRLVILGDCFDRGEQVTECLWLIYSLEQKARKQGGYVHFILGNHEIMNMNGDWRYIHPKYAFPSKSARQYSALYAGNEELWRWLCTKNIIERIGKVLFVHAGISPEFLQLRLSITDINKKARTSYMKARDHMNTDPFLSVTFNSPLSPFWYRGYYLGETSEELIDATLSHFKVSTIVTGHTVISHVNSFFNGKVINVNTDHASGNSEALLISQHRYFRVGTDGRKTRVK
jgi:hypothetical protein